MQNPALSLVEFHMDGDCPALLFVKVFLQGLPAFEGINRFSWFHIICELVKYPFQSFVQVIYEDIEEQKAEDGALWNPSNGRSPV